MRLETMPPLQREPPDSATRPTVIFIHLYKTGGSTLRSFLIRIFQKSLSLDHKHGFQEFIELPPDERDQFDCIYGHEVKLVHRFVSCPRQITLLRHPLAHRISLYKYTFQLTPEFFHKQGKTVTLEKYLTWDQNPKGKIATDPLLRTLASRGSHSHPDPRPATPEMLEQVKTMCATSSCLSA